MGFKLRIPLKGTLIKVFHGFFHESVSNRILSNSTMEAISIFTKIRGDIRKVITGINNTGDK
jgi:hypothetical protein